jgi:predicted rRNA methylase YqxC with S4 and FtsJ domains
MQPGSPALTLLVMDVSFISATLLLAPVFAAAPSLTEAVILVKPQFEAGRENVGKGGIVRDPEAHQQAIDRVARVRPRPWLAGRRDHSLANHRRGRQSRVPALRAPRWTADVGLNFVYGQ